MSRTIQQIYDALVTEKQTNAELSALQPNIDNSQTLLRDLTSSSKVAVWRLEMFVFAVGIWMFEKILDLHYSAVENLRYTLVTGTDIWYAERAKEFQYGDTLTWNGTQYAYEVIDETKRIVAFSSAITESGIVGIKVAKDNGSGLPTKLSGTELTAFTAFMAKEIFAGVDYTLVSIDADTAKLYLTVLYDGLILSATGESIETPGTYPVEDAVNTYLANLDFNGVFRVDALINDMQAVSGVISVIPSAISCAPNGGNYVDVMAKQLQDYTAAAGYMIVDGSFPLSTTLTYILK